MNFAKLRKLRISNSLSIEELAELLDKSPSTISRYESGTRIPPLFIAGKYIDLFNLDGEDIKIIFFT